MDSGFRKRSQNLKHYTPCHINLKMINSIYKKLNGEEIPVSQTSNPMSLVMFVIQIKYIET